MLIPSFEPCVPVARPSVVPVVVGLHDSFHPIFVDCFQQRSPFWLFLLGVPPGMFLIFVQKQWPFHADLSLALPPFLFQSLELLSMLLHPKQLAAKYQLRLCVLFPNQQLSDWHFVRFHVPSPISMLKYRFWHLFLLIFVPFPHCCYRLFDCVLTLFLKF